MLKFLPKFKDYLTTLEVPAAGNDDEDSPKVAAHLHYFIELLEKEYAQKLTTLAALLAESQITFEYVWGLFVPGSIILTHCQLTNEPLAVRLISCNLVPGQNGAPPYWSLACENVDVQDGLPGLSDQEIRIWDFTGAQDVVNLAAFPMSPYIEAARVREMTDTLIRQDRGGRSSEPGDARCSAR